MDQSGSNSGENYFSVFSIRVCPFRSALIRVKRFSISERLAGLERMHDALLRLRHLREGDEVLALEVEQPLFVDLRAAFDQAAAQGVGDAAGDFHIVFGKTVADISLNAVANLGYADCRFLKPVFPGATLAALVLAVNLLGDWLRDALNPKLR